MSTPTALPRPIPTAAPVLRPLLAPGDTEAAGVVLVGLDTGAVDTDVTLDSCIRFMSTGMNARQLWVKKE